VFAFRPFVNSLTWAPDLFLSREARDRRGLLEVLWSSSVLAEGRFTVSDRKPFDDLADLAKAKTETPSGSGDPEGVDAVWSGLPNEFLTGWRC
jgi:hypothetical protein